MDAELNGSWMQVIVGQVEVWVSNLSLSLTDLSLIAALGLSWVALFLALAAIKRIKAQADKSFRLYEKMAHDLQIASSGAIGMGQRIISLEKKLTAKKSELAHTPTNSAPIQLVSPSANVFAPTLPASKNAPIAEEARPVKKPDAEPDNPFDLAKKLLSRGMSEADVASRCGLSLSETALMALVMRNKQQVAGRFAS